jgi:hypothetical protein
MKIDVQPGQVWRDMDSRMGGLREIKVVEVSTRYAVVVSRTSDSEWGKRESRIRLDRFRRGSTGYELIASAPGS